MFLSFCQTRLKRTSVRDAYIYSQSDNGSAAWKYTFSIMENFCSLLFLKKTNKEGFFPFSVFPKFQKHILNIGDMLKYFLKVWDSKDGTRKIKTRMSLPA